MIYLLQDCYKDDSGIYHDILKIGYSKDSFLDNRVNQYNTHNYGYRFLNECPGEEYLETYLHNLFSDYRLSPCFEWFEYNQEIVDIFNNLCNRFIPISNYVELLRNYIIEEILIKPEEIYLRHANELVKELRELYETKYSYLPWEEDIYLQRFKDTLENLYNSSVNYWKTIDFLSETDILSLCNERGMIDLNENPWKNRAELYFKTIGKNNKITAEDFEKLIEAKKKRTENLLNSYQDTREEAKHDLAKAYQYIAKSKNYKDDYVAVNEHAGSDIQPVYNNLVLVADIRTYEIQQIDYKDRFTVFNTLASNNLLSNEDELIHAQLKEFEELTLFSSKLKLVCTTGFNPDLQDRFLKLIPQIFENYYKVIGPEKCKALEYRQEYLKSEYLRQFNNQFINISDEIFKEFQVGSKYTKSDIKAKLGKIFEECNYKATPKASELEKYFELKECLISNKETGKRDSGFEIIGKK